MPAFCNPTIDNLAQIKIFPLQVIQDFLLYTRGTFRFLKQKLYWNELYDFYHQTSKVCCVNDMKDGLFELFPNNKSVFYNIRE